MKVSLVTSWVSRNAGGLFQSVRALAQCLALQPKTVVEVFGLSDEFSAADASSWHPVVPRTFPCLGPRRFGFSSALNRALCESGSDLVHTHGIWLAHAMAPVAWHRRTGRPLIVSPRGMLDPWILRRSPWKKRLASWAYVSEHLTEASCLHALCQAEVESMRAYGLRKPICLIPNGIDLPKSPSVGSSVLPWPIHRLRGSGRKALLFLGRMHPKKGLKNLLTAWSSLGAERRDWTLAIAGWDELGHERELKQLATSSHIRWIDLNESNSDKPKTEAEKSASVWFLGPLVAEAKSAWLENSEAVVLPSFSEGLPMAILEAWSFARPALMTPACHIPEGFKTGAALRIETEPQSIRTGLQTLFSMSDADRRAMGQRGFQLVTERFNWSKIAQDMQSVFKWVLGAGSQPDSVQC